MAWVCSLCHSSAADTHGASLHWGREGHAQKLSTGHCIFTAVSRNLLCKELMGKGLLLSYKLPAVPVPVCLPALSWHTWNAKEMDGALAINKHQASHSTCSPFPSASLQLWALFKQMGKSRLQRLLIIQLCSIPVWADTSLPWFPHAYPRELALPKLYPSKFSLPNDFKQNGSSIHWFSLRPSKFFPHLPRETSSMTAGTISSSDLFLALEGKKKPGWVFIHICWMNEISGKSWLWWQPIWKTARALQGLNCVLSLLISPNSRC